jgi:hypothetical protein
MRDGKEDIVAFPLTIHYDNSPGFADPHVWGWYDASVSTQEDVAAAGVDAFGPFFHVKAKRKDFGFKFKQGSGSAGPWEGDRLDRYYEAIAVTEAGAGITLQRGSSWLFSRGQGTKSTWVLLNWRTF